MVTSTTLFDTRTLVHGLMISQMTRWDVPHDKNLPSYVYHLHVPILRMPASGHQLGSIIYHDQGSSYEGRVINGIPEGSGESRFEEVVKLLSCISPFLAV